MEIAILGIGISFIKSQYIFMFKKFENYRI